MPRRPVEFVSAAATNGTTGTSIALTSPASTQAGDLLLAFIIRNDVQHDASTPFEKATSSASGWNIPDGRGMYRNYDDFGNPLPGWAMRNCWCWRIATASEPGSHTFNMQATADNQIGGVMLAYRYSQQTWDLNDDPWPFYTAPSTSGTLTDVTNVGPSLNGIADSRLLTVTPRGTTVPAGSPSFSSGTARVNANANGVSFITIADEAITSNGATGTRTVTGGATGPNPEVTRTILLQPFRDSPPVLMP